MSITPYTVISIENLLFVSENLTDENNLIVFRNVQKYIHHSNRFERYEIISNNKFSIEITVYGVILIINCILAFV
jgi:hypothetical protein